MLLAAKESLPQQLTIVSNLTSRQGLQLNLSGATCLYL